MKAFTLLTTAVLALTTSVPAQAQTYTDADLKNTMHVALAIGELKAVCELYHFGLFKNPKVIDVFINANILENKDLNRAGKKTVVGTWLKTYPLTTPICFYKLKELKSKL